MRIYTVFLAAALSLFATASKASDAKFFHNIQGKWSGPGEIVAGKYKGTKFVCTFGGTRHSATNSGMDIDGACRVGMFSQKMNAEIIRQAGKYIGQFLDGAKGDGMDVTGGRYTSDRLVVDIKRKDLDGIMVANLSDPNMLNVTISVRHNSRIVPVIGMRLSRQPGQTITGSVN